MYIVHVTRNMPNRRPQKNEMIIAWLKDGKPYTGQYAPDVFIGDWEGASCPFSDVEFWSEGYIEIDPEYEG